MRKTIHYEYGIAYVQNVKLTILKETNAPSVKNSYKKRILKITEEDKNTAEFLMVR